MDNLSPPVEWIRSEGEPWARVIALRDVLGRPPDDPDLQAARAAVAAHPLVKGLLDEAGAWPGAALKNHNDAKHLIHKLPVLAEFGLSHTHPQLAPVVESILNNPSAEGAFQTMLHLSKRFGGDDADRLSWMLCDAPTVLYGLLSLGVPAHTPAVARAIDHLLGLAQDYGWPCVAAPEFGAFRGPGRKDDPCPYATLVSLRALSLTPGAESDAVRTGIGALLRHWETQKERKIYLFGIGTDFRKPKYPFIWYDILHVADVLSRFPAARADVRLHAMVGELHAQADAQGRFTAGSMYRAWKEWDFADKKAPSPTLTAVAWRVFKRMEI
ncbi:MAG: hypothetical protein JXB47_12315 [Anaerolineae bacterium]|nr:hypothetical protein [Anaerolineae bacterium]